MAVEVQGLELDISAKTNLGQSASDIKKLSDALKGATFTKSKAEAMQKMASAVNALALAINKIDATKINGMASALEAMSKIKVNKSVSTAIEALATSLNSLDTRKFYGQVNALNRTLTPLANTMKTIAEASKGLNINARFGKGVEKAAEALEAEKSKGTKGEKFTPEQGVRNVVSMGEAFRQAYGKINQKISQSSFGKVFDQMKKDVGIVINSVKRLGSAFVSAIKFARDLGKKFGTVVAMASRITIINPFKNVANSIGNALKRLDKFWASLKRIALYRAIRSAIKEISQGIREGVTNLYQWSKLTGEDMYRFRDTMNTLSTAALYLKNSLGAMVSPILNMLAPAIDYIIDKFVALLNVINQALARIAGQSTWTAAIKYPKEFADSVGGAANKVKDNIQDFDELHILRTPSSGGGGAAEDYSKMFEERTFETAASEWAANLKEAIKKGDWAGAGEILGEQLNLAVDSVDWNDLGKRLATKLNNAFLFWYSFLKKTDFNKFGDSFANFLNGGLETLDTELIGKTFARKWTAVIDFVYGFVSTFNFSQFGTKVSEFVQGWFEEIDGNKLGETLSLAIKGAFKAGIAFFSNEDARREFINDINGFFAGLDWSEIHLNAIDFAKTFTNWLKNSMNDLDTASIGQSISEAIHTALDMAITFIDEGGLDALVDGIIDIINNIDWYDALIKGLYIGAKIVEALFDVIIGVLTGQTSKGASYVQTKVVDTSYGAYKASQYTGKTYTKQYVSSDMGDGITTGIATAISGADTSKVTSAFKALLEKAFSAAIKVAEFIVDPAAKAIAEAITTFVYGYDLEGNDVDDYMKGDPVYEFFKSAREAKQTFFSSNDNQKIDSATKTAQRLAMPLEYLLGKEFARNSSLSGVLSKASSSFSMIGGLGVQSILEKGVRTAEFSEGRGKEILAEVERQRKASKGGAASIGKGQIANITKINALVSKTNKGLSEQNKSYKDLDDIALDVLGKVSDKWEDVGKSASVDAVGGVVSAASKISATVSGLATDMKGQFDGINTSVKNSSNDMSKAVVTSISNTATGITEPLNKVKSQITGKFAEAKTQASNSAKDLNTAIVTSINKTVTDIATPLANVKNKIVSTYSNTKTDVSTAMSNITTAVVTGIGNTINSITTPLKNVKDTISGSYSSAATSAVNSINEFAPKIQGALNNVAGITSGGLNGIKGVWDSYRSSVISAGNGTLAVCEALANGVVDAYNSLKNTVNSVVSAINSSIGALGGKKATTIPSVTLTKISLPRLATGGIVDSPVNALIGEAGKEAVLPLERNTGWMDTLAERVGGNNEAELEILREQNDLLRQLVAKKTGITSREIYDAVRNENQERFVRTGENALVM